MEAIIKNVQVIDRSELSNLPEYVTPVTTDEGNALMPLQQVNQILFLNMVCLLLLLQDG